MQLKRMTVKLTILATNSHIGNESTLNQKSLL